MSRSTQNNRTLGIFAGAWFAAACCVPLTPVWMETVSVVSVIPWSELLLKHIALTGILPISISGLCGYRVGVSIFDPNQVKTAKQAVVQGIKVALWSYAIFAILWSVIVIISMMISERMPNQGFIIPLLQFTLGALVMVGVIAAVVLGWLVILAGATAGWLLFKIRPLLSKLQFSSVS